MPMNLPNKTWRREYEALEELEAGIVLTGSEAKSLREGRAKLEASYVKFIGGEPFLVNAEIFRYQFDGDREYNPTRSRKLLMNKKEILKFRTKMQSQPGLTIIAASAYSKGQRIKVKLVLARGRKETEKRRLEKGKEVKRAQEQELKTYMKR
jgi:SsrA-binding protein